MNTIYYSHGDDENYLYRSNFPTDEEFLKKFDELFDDTSVKYMDAW